MDNKNFKKRAETMKDLFLAGIPRDVISEVVQISESTVQKDRVRVAKLYGIEIPRPLSPYLIGKNHYKFFFKIYLQASLKGDYDDPIYKAARIISNIDSIENHINSLQMFYEALQCPHASIKGSIDGNNIDLIEKLLRDYKKRPLAKSFEEEFYEEFSRCYFIKEFFTKIYLGDIPYESFNRDSDVKEAATMYFAEKRCNSINSLRINNPRELLRPFLSKLDEMQLSIFQARYGLNCERKKTLIEISRELGITKNRAENICRKAYEKVYHELEEVDFYPFDSSGKMKYLERKYENIKELYMKRCETTEKSVETFTDMKNFNKNLDWIEKAASYPTHSAKVTFLTQRIKDVQLPKPLVQKLQKYKHIVDLVEDWKSLRLNNDSLEIVDNLLKENRVDRKRVTENDILLARRIIQKESEK